MGSIEATWRPKCYERDWLEWDQDFGPCKVCPFKFGCREASEQRRIDLYWEYRNEGD